MYLFNVVQRVDGISNIKSKLWGIFTLALGTHYLFFYLEGFSFFEMQIIWV